MEHDERREHTAGLREAGERVGHGALVVAELVEEHVQRAVGDDGIVPDLLFLPKALDAPDELVGPGLRPHGVLQPGARSETTEQGERSGVPAARRCWPK